MGQMTYGLIYGIPDQKIEGYAGEETEEQYVKERNDDIQAIVKKTKCDYYTACYQIRPEWEGESEPAFLGFFVAVGASGKEGIPKLGSFQLDALDADKRYKKSMANARTRWAEFSAWCAGTKGINMPTPQLWLIETEVA